MNGFRYTLTLKEPVLANSLGGDPNSAKSLFYIPGGAIRGAFIQAYLKTKDAVHPDFRRLFLSGETRYLNAYPLFNEKRALPTPLSWQVERKPGPDAKKVVYRKAPEEKATKLAPFEFWIKQADMLYGIEEEWQINVHTQRDAERGRAIQDAGAVYRYIALPAGMKLEGAVLTQKGDDVPELRQLLGQKKTILLGKARTAGYGAAELEISDLSGGWRETDGELHVEGDTFTLTLLSPAILRDAYGQHTLDILPALIARLDNSIEILAVHRKEKIIGGFNRTWGLPLPQTIAVAAGSIFQVKAKVTDELLKKLHTLEEIGLGERRAEGFGRVAINLDLPGDEVRWEFGKIELASVSSTTTVGDNPVANIMLTRLLRRDLDERVVHAARGAMQAYQAGKVPNSQLSRWRVILRDALEKHDIPRVQTFCEENKGKPGWKKMEKARVTFNGQQPRLTEWIGSVLDDPQTLSQAWGTNPPSSRAIGGISVQIGDKLNAEYRLRLLDAVLAVMAKEMAKETQMPTNRTLHRSITERWVITGTLELLTPAHFGNGDADPLTDMPLLVDEASGDLLLPGTSIAGALRNYLRERDLGFSQKETNDSLAAQLLGGARSDDDGAQSPLIVYDALGQAAGLELRDGVAIDPETRTAADEKKFDMQLLAAGSTFKLCFELAVGDKSVGLGDALATALYGLEQGEITLGARKRRGFGQVTVKNWLVKKYDLRTKEGLLAWLSSEPIWEEGQGSIADKLGATLIAHDARKMARLEATFALESTLMIRSGFGQSDSGPDLVHLHSPRPGKDAKRVPVIPGTSWAGALRQRALKIARTVSDDTQAVDDDGKLRFKKVIKNGNEEILPVLLAEVFVDEMFGPSNITGEDSKNAKASRVSICESEIEQAQALVMTRVKIDRFTGGSFESALFSEQPAVGKPETRVRLDLTLRSPNDAELGLLLLLLKDLWTGDLPIGGESAIGRGRLKGISATLKTSDDKWEFHADGNQVNVTPSLEKPEEWVKIFNNKLTKAQVTHA